MRGLAAAFDHHLEQRLRPGASAPVVVGLSGGGDSAALLALTAAWARPRGRPVLALTVDHGLQAQGGAWSAFAADLAARLGAAHRVLPWTGEKPARGLAAAARGARHALLAQATREAGASVLLLGHTADDRLEGARMAAEGSTLGALRPWAPSPVWPEGRGVMLLRPLLDVRRAALRAWLAERDLPWVEDPANADPRSARARARLVTETLADPPAVEAPRRSPLLDAAAVTADGRIVVERAALAREDGEPRFLAAALASAAGGDGTLRGERVRALLAGLAGQGRVTATLGGARVDADEAAVSLAREPGRQPPPTVPLSAGRIWDGRFELMETRPGWSVAPLRGRTGRLPDRERRALAGVPATARGVLPVLVGPDGAATCPVLTGEKALAPLVGGRLSAALGGVVREA